MSELRTGQIYSDADGNGNAGVFTGRYTPDGTPVYRKPTPEELTQASGAQPAESETAWYSDPEFIAPTIGSVGGEALAGVLAAPALAVPGAGPVIHAGARKAGSFLGGAGGYLLSGALGGKDYDLADALLQSGQDEALASAFGAGAGRIMRHGIGPIGAKAAGAVDDLAETITRGWRGGAVDAAMPGGPSIRQEPAWKGRGFEDVGGGSPPSPDGVRGGLTPPPRPGVQQAIDAMTDWFGAERIPESVYKDLVDQAGAATDPDMQTVIAQALATGRMPQAIQRKMVSESVEKARRSGIQMTPGQSGGPLYAATEAVQRRNPATREALEDAWAATFDAQARYADDLFPLATTSMERFGKRAKGLYETWTRTLADQDRDAFEAVYDLAQETPDAYARARAAFGESVGRMLERSRGAVRVAKEFSNIPSIGDEIDRTLRLLDSDATEFVAIDQQRKRLQRLASEASEKGRSEEAGYLGEMANGLLSAQRAMLPPKIAADWDLARSRWSTLKGYQGDLAKAIGPRASDKDALKRLSTDPVAMEAFVLFAKDAGDTEAAAWLSQNVARNLVSSLAGSGGKDVKSVKAAMQAIKKLPDSVRLLLATTGDGAKVLESAAMLEMLSKPLWESATPGGGVGRVDLPFGEIVGGTVAGVPVLDPKKVARAVVDVIKEGSVPDERAYSWASEFIRRNPRETVTDATILLALNAADRIIRIGGKLASRGVSQGRVGMPDFFPGGDAESTDLPTPALDRQMME